MSARARAWAARGGSPLARLAPHLTLTSTLAIAAVFVVVAIPGIIVQDTWLALAAGREVAHHFLPARDHLTVFAAGRRWVDQQWLGQLLLYWLALAGGVKAVVLVGAAAALGAWGLAIGAAGRRGPPAAAAVTALVVAGVLSSPWGLQARPQELVLPLFAGIVWLLLADPLLVRRRTLLVLALLVVWANLHGSVLLGVAVVGAYALVAARRGPRRRLWPYLATPLTVLASPYAAHLVGYYRLMLSSAPFRSYVIEWQPSRPAGRTAIFYVLAAATLAVVARRRRVYGPGELAILAVTALAAALAIRNIVWFALAAAAILPVREGARTFDTAAAGAVALAAACVIPIAAAVALTRPPTYWQGGVSTAAARVLRPLAARPGIVLADDHHADWLLWHFPQLRGRVVYDVRFELLTNEQLQTVANVFGGRLGTLGACLVVVDPVRAEHMPGRLVWQDPTTAVVDESGGGRACSRRT